MLGNVGAKNGLVFVQVKILVLLDIVEEFNHNLVFFMCKGAVVSIIAFVDVIWVELAELSLVAFRMIELLQLVVSIVALVTHWTRKVSANIRAHWRSI